MKAKQSRISVVARFAYIFATIVTIFAQLGAAPAALLNADDTATPSNVSATGKLNGDNVAGTQLALTVTFTGQQRFEIEYDPDQLEYDDRSTYADNSTGYIDRDAFFSSPAKAGNEDLTMNPVYLDTRSKVIYFTLKKPITDAGVGFDFYWTTKNIASLVFGTFGPGDFEGHSSFTMPSPDQTTEPTTDPTTDPSTNPSIDEGLKLTQIDHTGTTYDLGEQVNLKVEADAGKHAEGQSYLAIGIGANAHITSFLKFNEPATAQLAIDHGYTLRDGKPTTDAEGNTVWYYEQPGGSYFEIVLYKSMNEYHIAWSNSATGVQVGLMAFDTLSTTIGVPGLTNDQLTLTSAYMSGGTPTDTTGEASTSLTINDKKVFEPNNYHFEAFAQADIGSSLSSFPLYSVQKDGQTGIVYDTSGTNGTLANENAIRKAIANATPFSPTTWSSAATTTSSTATGYTKPTFTTLSGIDKATGAKTGEATPFEPGEQYTLTTDNTVGDGRYKRVDYSQYSGKNYYMPDGAPTITFDDNGKMSIVSGKEGNGKAKVGQYQVDNTGKELTVHLYKIKQVKVVDQTGAVVAGATLDMGSMKATTATNGIGEMQPSDYDATKKGPFYYPEADPVFAGIKFSGSGYSYDGNFTVSLGADDKLTLDANAKAAAVQDDGQTLVLTVHHDTAKDTEVNLKKVAADDLTKQLAGADFTIEESNNATDAKQFGSMTTDADGMIKASEEAASKTTKRWLHITETKAPTDYTIGNATGYYAVWEKGKGFIAVDNVNQSPTATKSSDQLASVDADGTLVIQDPPEVAQGGEDSGISFRYVGVDNDGKKTGADGIGGAALPALDTNKQYTDNGVGFKGLGSLIYSTGDPASLMQATGLANTVNEVSAIDGQGKVQQLWALGGLAYNWATAGKDTMLYKLGQAITTHVFPSDPKLSYQLNTSLQRQRAAAGSEAYNYYSFGSRMGISNDTGTLKATNLQSANDRDNLITVGADNKSIIATLIKVKHVALKDANGNPIQGATVQFSNLMNTTPTDANGEAELVPVDSSGKATDFVYPKASQKLVKVTSGNKQLQVDANSGAYFMINSAASDQLVAVNGNANFAITAGTTNDKGQYIQLKTTTAKTTIAIHKQSATEHSRALQDAQFKVWTTGQTEADAVTTTTATDANGNTTVDLPAPSSDGQYSIKETAPGVYAVKGADGTVTRKVEYALDTAVHTFSWKAGSGVVAVGAGETLVATATAEDSAHAGMLIFNDMPGGGAGGPIDGGGNGGNGGKLNLVKGDATSTKTPPDGATFAITETTPNATNKTAATVTSVQGKLQYDLGPATLGERDFTIQEKQAPSGYAVDQTLYQLRILADGTMYLGSGASDYQTLTDTTSANGMASLDGNVVKLSDLPLTNATAPLILTKVDATDTSKTLSGAHFIGYVDEVANQFTKQPLAVSQDLDLTSGVDGTVKVTYDMNTGTGRVIELKEDQAPEGYQVNDNQYNIKVNADGTPSGVGRFDQATNTITYGNTTDDGVVSIKDGQVVFEDEPDPNAAAGTITLKKVDADDHTKALDGAEFQIDRIYSPANPKVLETLKTVKADGTGMLKAQLADKATAQGTFQIKETKAPDGYALDTKTYYFYWSKAKGVTSAGSDASMSNSPTIYPEVVDGTGTLVFADAAATNADFKLLKKDASGQNPLSGAKFTLTDLNTEQTYAESAATDADGNVTVSVAIGDGSEHLFEIKETTAPAGYAQAAPLYAKWRADTGVTVVGASQSGLTTMINGKAMVANGILMIQDQPLQGASFKIKKTALATDRTQGIPGGAAAGDPYFALAEMTDASGKLIEGAGTAMANAEITASGLTDSIQIAPSTAELHLIKVTEGQAPTGYVQDQTVYYVTVSSKGGVVGVSSKPEIKTDGSSSDNGVVKIDDHATVNFGDQKISTISVKKTPIDDLATGLAGAKFKLYTVSSDAADLSTLTPQELAATGADGLTSTPMTSDSGTFAISESQAPSGYDKDVVNYYFNWNNQTGVTAVWTKGKTPGSVVKNADGKQVIGIGANGELDFSDAKSVDLANLITVKKVDQADPTQGLAGAKFTLTDLGNGSVTTGNTTFNGLTAETKADGTQQFAVTPTASGQLMRIFRIDEVQAPTDYLRNRKPYYLSWDTKNGVATVGETINQARTQNLTTSVVNVVKAADTNKGYVTYADTANKYTIHTALRTVDQAENGRAIAGTKITLSNSNGGTGTPQTLPITDAKGNVTVRPQVIAAALGLTDKQMTGSVDVHLTVDGGRQYTNPVDRIVRFTFSDGTTAGGFSVFNNGVKANDSSTALKANDKMVVDHACDSAVLAGNLTALLRKDTLNAKAISDTNQVGAGIDGTQFEMDFVLNGTPYTTKVTTAVGADGEVVLPDPNTLLKPQTPLAPNTSGVVTIKQVNAPQDYAQNTDTMTFTYSTGYGYAPLSGDIDPDPDVKDAIKVVHKDGDIDSIRADFYFLGGSEITYYLTKQISSLNLDLAPASMNFGDAKLYSGPQTRPLLAADAANQATFNTNLLQTTDANYGQSTQTTETNRRVMAQVTQTGRYADGWRLKLGLGELTAENGTDTITGEAINFANFATITRDGTTVHDKRTGAGSLALNMGQTINTVDLSATDTAAGTYAISWALNDISMSLPANVQRVDSNYQAPLSWEVTDAP